MSELSAGFSRKDITAWEPLLQLWGWFMHENKARGVETPLYVRAMFLSGGSQRVAYVCADLGFMSVAVRRAVLTLLREEHPECGIGPHNLMLTATHTHSGPCGFSDLVGQNSGCFGFSPVVMSTVVEGIVAAIVEAYERLEPASLRVGSAQIPTGEPVAFNRSVCSYNRNPEVEKVREEHKERATNRKTVTLRVDASDGRTLGCVNWFAVHATSVHAENDLLHSDNKGLAATMWEDELRKDPKGRPDVVAIFAQEAAGDVSPNFRYNRKRDKMIGAHEDDKESALSNARIQLKYAKQAYEQATSARPSHVLGGRVEHVDMSDFSFVPEFVGRDPEAKTYPGMWGLVMPGGTAEGPGPVRPFLPLLRRWMTLRRLHKKVSPRKDVKIPFLELGKGVNGRFMGLIPARLGLALVGRLDPTIGYIRMTDMAGCLGDEPWLPNLVPVQVLRLGPVVVAGIPGEPTTMCGVRLRESLRRGLNEAAQYGVDEVLVNGYANGYAGYITTHEEYQQQEYEGAYTLFGPWTLNAYQQTVYSLARLPVISDGSEEYVGSKMPEITYDTLLERRIMGRQGAWGIGTGELMPEISQAQEARLRQALGGS